MENECICLCIFYGSIRYFYFSQVSKGVVVARENGDFLADISNGEGCKRTHKSIDTKRIVVPPR